MVNNSTATGSVAMGLASLLLVFHTGSAFHPSGPGVHIDTSKPNLASSSIAVVGGEANFGHYFSVPDKLGHPMSAISMSQDSKLLWFVKTETFKSSLSFPEIKPHLDAHKAWVDGLRKEGVSITSGYRVDANGRPGGGGLMLFKAEDYAAAERLVLKDPLIANSCVDWQLNQWIADVGDIDLVEGGQWYAKQAAQTDS